MAQGTWAATTASAVVIAADQDRESLTVQLLVKSASGVQTSLGFGAAAVAGEGVAMLNLGDPVTVRGHLAKLACNVITSAGTSSGGYQTT